MTNRTKNKFTSHCRIAAKTNFLMLLLFLTRFAHACYSSRMIDRFLNWGDHGKRKSGKIKSRCPPPPPTNIVFMDLRVMDVVFVISLTPKLFPRRRIRVNFSSLFSLDLISIALTNRFLALMTVCCSILDCFGQVICQSSLLLDTIC